MLAGGDVHRDHSSSLSFTPLSMSPREARGRLAELCGLPVRDGRVDVGAEYIDVLLSRQANALAGESMTLRHVLERLACGLVITPRELEWLEQLVDEEEEWAEFAEVFRAAATGNRVLYKHHKWVAHIEIEKYGDNEAAAHARNYGPNVLVAFKDASKEHKRKLRSVGMRPHAHAPRARESRPRPVRSRGSRRLSSGSASSDDDGLADLHPRCPRCGGDLRPLLPSPHWTCDPCADELLERMVQHELVRVLDEADEITRRAA